MMKPELCEKVASITADLLEEHYGDKFVFDPIVVIPEIDDHYSDDVFPYLEIYIVFEGDQSKMDRGWKGDLIGLLIDELEEVGIDDFPSPRFVPKSGWNNLERKLKRKPNFAIA